MIKLKEKKEEEAWRLDAIILQEKLLAIQLPDQHAGKCYNFFFLFIFNWFDWLFELNSTIMREIIMFANVFLNIFEIST